MRELIKECAVLTEFDVSVLQLVEMGLCSYSEVKDGTLNFMDIIKLLEYAKLKNNYTSWKQQKEANESKARELWLK